MNSRNVPDLVDDRVLPGFVSKIDLVRGNNLQQRIGPFSYSSVIRQKQFYRFHILINRYSLAAPTFTYNI
jgi:hypothetical protein